MTLGWLASPGMDADEGDYYRLDEVSVHEREAERILFVEEPSEVISNAPRALAGRDPVAYDASSGRMVFTETLNLPVGGTFSATFEARGRMPDRMGDVGAYRDAFAKGAEPGSLLEFLREVLDQARGVRDPPRRDPHRRG